MGKVAVIAGGPFFGKTKIFTGSPAIGAELDAGNVTVTINGTSFTKSGLLAHTTGKVVAISLGVDAKGYLMFQGVL